MHLVGWTLTSYSLGLTSVCFLELFRQFFSLFLFPNQTVCLFVLHQFLSSMFHYRVIAFYVCTKQGFS